jgi:hypothetical protein
MFASPLELQRGTTILRDGRFAYTDFELAASARERTLADAPTGIAAC